jgi:hypothetical protein
MAEPSLELLKKLKTKFADDWQRTRAAERVEGGGGGPHMPEMGERLAKLESAFDWAKTLVGIVGALIVTIMIGGFAFLGFQLARVDSKVYSVGEQVASLPGKINSNLEDLARTLSEAITASKQTPPQVLLMQAPQPQSMPPNTKP